MQKSTCDKKLRNKKPGMQLQDDERLAGGGEAGKEQGGLGQTDVESQGQCGGWAGLHFWGKRGCIAQDPLGRYLIVLHLRFSMSKMKMLHVNTS